MTKRTLKRAFNKFDVIKKTRDPEVPGILGFTINGKNAVEVGNRAGYVWVRLRSNTNEVIQAYNDQVSPVYGLPVVVVRDEIDRTKYKIKGRDLGTYQNWGGSAYLPRHGNQHSFNPEAGGGGDVVFVFSRQFMPLALQPSGTSGAGCVLVQPYAYYQGTTWKYAGGTGTASFLPYKPTGSSARMVLVYLDNDSNPQLLGGSDYFAVSITGNAAVLPYVPAIPDSADIPLGAVRLVSGTSAILWDNIYDLRPIIVSDGFIPTGTASKHEIQDDGTPLADRAALNFVGSNFVVYNTAGATNVSGTAVSAGGGGGIPERSLPIYEDGAFKVTGTVINFTNNLDVIVSGSVAYIQAQTGGGGGGSNVLPIQDSGAFVVTGTALSFDGDLLASAVGTVGHVSIPAGTFASGSHTHPAGATAVQIFDDSIFKVTGTAISFDTNLTVAVTGTVAFVSSAGGDLPWFNVLDYGATNGGESTVAFANAIADLNAAGRGVLYVPAGSYTTSGSYQITAPFMVMGDGVTSFDDLQYLSRVVCSRGNVTLFTCLSKIGKFQDIALVCDSGGTPTAGAGISVSGSYFTQRVDYENVTVRGFYDNIDVQVGHQWTMNSCYLAAPVRYALHIRNIVNADAGDWAISNSGFYSELYNSTDAIRIESSGGGKITNVKINAAPGGNTFTNGINVAMSGSKSTSILLLNNLSIENITGIGLKVTTAASSDEYHFIILNGVQIAQYSNTDDYAVSISSSTINKITQVIIDNCIFRASPSSLVEAVSLTKIDRVYIGRNDSWGFTGLLSHSGCTNLWIQELNAVTDSHWVAKGDLLAGSGTSSAGILPIGANDSVLTADSTQPLGVKWATPAAAGGLGAVAVYDNDAFIVSGTAFVFNTDLEVVASGTFAYINSQASGGGTGNKLPIYDNSVFKITGTSISFDDNLSVAVTGTVAFVSSTGGGGYSYARYSHTVPQNTNGGSGTVGAWTTRVLNTENDDPDSIGTLSGNQITLGAGSYQVRAVAPFYRCNGDRLRIRDVTNSVTLVMGRLVSLLITTDYVFTAELSGRFTLAGTAAIELQYYIGSKTNSDINLGAPGNTAGESEVYAQVELWKE